LWIRPAAHFNKFDRCAHDVAVGCAMSRTCRRDQSKPSTSAAICEPFSRITVARNNADWQRLLEICALADTLILDEDCVYDPTSFNDRLLVGLKGTMSEAELHVIKARIRGGILNKVRRGEYRCPLPTGLIYDQSGKVAFDPDAHIRETIVHFFDTFSRVGSACQTVKAFRKRHGISEGCPSGLGMPAYRALRFI
jgi:DNA invertase Pin-like site-specific DNA recombinase